MNIFFLSFDPKECACMHVDKHVVKMILESAQILCTSHRVLDGKLIIEGRKKRYRLPNDEVDGRLYAATHVNHPSTKWTRQCAENYQWLFSLFMELLKEYTFRYQKSHACTALVPFLQHAPGNIDSSTPFEPPWPAMPDEFKIPGDSMASYRQYYNVGKRHLHKWKGRDVPLWITI